MVVVVYCYVVVCVVLGFVWGGVGVEVMVW